MWDGRVTVDAQFWLKINSLSKDLTTASSQRKYDISPTSTLALCASVKMTSCLLQRKLQHLNLLCAKYTPWWRLDNGWNIRVKTKMKWLLIFSFTSPNKYIWNFNTIHTPFPRNIVIHKAKNVETVWESWGILRILNQIFA